MSQLIYGLTVANIAASTTRYLGLMGFNAQSVTFGPAAQPISVGGKISLLAFRPTATPAGLVTITLFVNGVATALTCSTSNATTAHDSVHEITIAAGDLVGVEITAAAGVTSRAWSWNVKWVPTVAGETIQMGSSSNTPTANMFVCIGGETAATVTETNVRQVIPETSGVLKKLYVAVDTDPTAGGSSIAFTLFKNSVAQSLVATVAAGSTTNIDNTNSVSFTAGDVASIKVTTSGSPTLSPFRWCVVYVSPNPGFFIVLGSTGGNLMSGSGTRFMPISGFRGVSSTESVVQFVSNAFTAKGAYHRLSTAPGAGTAWDLFLRVNTANSALVVNIANTATTGGANIDAAVALDDIIDMSQALGTGVPTAGNWKYALIGYLADPVVTATNTGGFFNFKRKR